MSDIAFSAVTSVSGTTNQIGSTGGLNPVITIANNVVMPGTGGATLPQGNTAARAGNAGTMRFNTQTTNFEATPDGLTWYPFVTSTGTVNSVSGTANQIDVSPTTGNSVVSLDSALILPGTLTTSHTVTLSGLTASTALVLDGSKNVVSLAYVSTGGTYGDTSNIMARDANGNTASNNIINAQTSTTSGGTITLTASSARTQVITGSSSTTVVLPDATTLLKGHTFYINNNSSGGLTVQTNGGGALFTGQAGNYVQVICTNNSTSTGSWDYHWLLPSTAPSGSIYLSNGITSGYRFSSATYPFTTTINQLLYSSASNTISGLATANSASLVTSSTGVPAWSSSMTDGQLIIGATGGTPIAASLTAGSGVTITPGTNSITISATGSGGTVTSVSGTANQIASTGGTTPVISIVSNAILPGTGGVTLPQGNTAARAGGAGTIRFNTQTNVFESTVDGIAWATIETSAIGVTSVSGTTNRITASPTTGAVVVDISASYVGQSSITTLGTITTGVWNGTAITVPFGGTGDTSFTAYAPICGGTTSTGALQSAGVGTSLQIFASGGSAALPSYKTWTVTQQIFGTPGTSTYTAPAGLVVAYVECIGGGGGSGGAANSAGSSSVSGGGGGGQWSASWLSAATIGVSQTVTVGAAGSAGSAGNNNGGDGGTSSFGALVSAGGGSHGLGAAAGAAASGGSGGGGGTGDISVSGNAGATGAIFATNTMLTSTGGGCGLYGKNTGIQIIPPSAVKSTGIPANGPGGGAGGSYTSTNSGDIAGLVGTAGVVIVTEYRLV